MTASSKPTLRPLASEAVRSIIALALALFAILVLLPAALMAAGP
jgi:hypothetical protein